MKHAICLWLGMSSLIAIAVVACSGQTPGSATATETPASTASPSPTADLTALSPTELKYRLLARFPNLFFCDPDQYPVAREVTDQDVASRVDAIQKNGEAYEAILNHLGLSGSTSLSTEQKRLVYAEYKRLNAIQLTQLDGDYRFDLRVSQAAHQALAVEGTISSHGGISIAKQQTTIATCPICLASSTLIATPFGQVPVRNLRTGDRVWTADRRGTRQLGIVLKTVRRPVPSGTPMVHLVLNDGRQLLVSPLHPTLEGSPVGDLVVGDWLDGARVRSIERTPLDGDSTYDLLPSGDTGAYWANGILIESTLAQPSMR